MIIIEGLSITSLITAFSGGLVSFLAPCVVPLLPTYVAYVTGVSVKDLTQKGESAFRLQIFGNSILYILGFSLIFVFLGAFAGSFGSLFRQQEFLVRQIGGVLLILFGLDLLGVFHLPFLKGNVGFLLPGWVSKLGPFRSIFLGAMFAVVWTPCVGAVLGSILTLAATTQGATPGAVLLFVYSLGISLPFLIFSFTISQSRPLLLKIESKLPMVLRIVGVVLIGIGLLLLTDTFKYVNSWIFDIAFRLGYQIR